MIIEQPSTWMRWLYPSAIWRMSHKERAVYLTFDDGPIPEATPFILDTLDRYRVKATFFMVGENVKKYPHLKREIEERGHRLGNHTYNHVGGLGCRSKEFLRNTYKADQLIHSKLFRPPRGWMLWTQYMRLRKKFTIIMWDVVTRDYSLLLTADDVVENVKHYTRNGSIITFHDSLKSIDKLQTALPRSIEWLQSEGYEFRLFDADQPRSRHLK